jgi:arylsulfatase A-like enzyme
MRPNILLIVLDTARAQNFSAFGYHKETSPHIDRLAEEGVVYSNCIAPAPWTLPSHASLFTGQFPSVHGAHGDHLYLDEGFPSLAQVLRGLGYSTLGMSSNVWVSEAFGMARGFDAFFKTWQWFQDETTTAQIIKPQGDGNRRPRMEALLRSLPRKGGLKTLLNALYGKLLWRRHDDGAARTNRELKRRLVDLSSPFFLFLNYMEPHAPYDAPGDYKLKHVSSAASSSEHVRRMIELSNASRDYHTHRLELLPRDFEVLRGLYDGEISYLDAQVGQVLRHMESLNLLDNTLVIVMSDHGENIGEHALMAHRFSVHETLLRVPLIVRYPQVFPPGGRVEAYVQLTDIFPTILDLLGVSPSELGLSLPGRVIDPQSLSDSQSVPIVAEYIGNRHTAEANDPDFDFEGSRYSRTYKALYEGDFKLIMSSDGAHELYDVVSDPQEAKNLVKERRDLADHMLEQLVQWTASLRSSQQPASDIDPTLDAMLEERLKALGYLG